MSDYAYTIGAGNPAISADEITALKEWAALMPAAPRIVNIGAEHGISTVALLETRPQATIYSVDMNECQSELDNVANAGLDAARVIRIRGRSQDIDPQPYAPIDLLFIDGDHAYNSVSDDIRVWTPIVKSGGLIIFHDYITPPIPVTISSRVYYAVSNWFIDVKCNSALLGCIETMIAFKVK